jgi:putative ABC transport system permease protein
MLLKIAFRTFLRNKLITILNIAGLAVGICCAVLVFLVAYLHTTYDDYHPLRASTYRIVTNYNYINGDRESSPGVPSTIADAVRKEYPFLDKVALINWYKETQVSSWNPGDTVMPLVKAKEQEAMAFVEPQFFEIFSYKWLQGNPATALKDSLSAVITKGYAEKYYGAADPIGRELRLDNKISVKITGVVDDIPDNTFIRQRIFVSYASRAAFEPLWTSNWNDTRSFTQCFTVLKNGASAAVYEEQLSKLGTKYLTGDDAKTRSFHIQPLSDVHLNTKYDAYLSKIILWSFALVGLFLIVTACVNFINMSTAQALTRTKEVGVKKTIGATRRQLITQFMLETAVVTLIAMALALFLAWLVIPSLNELFLSVFSVSLKPTLPLVIFLVIIFLFTWVLAGLYPAMVLSGFHPIQALTQKINAKTAGRLSLKRALVILQCVIAYGLIISALTMSEQIRFTKKASMGFDKNGIMVVPLPGNDSARHAAVYQKLKSLSTVQEVSLMHTPPAYRSNITNPFFYQKAEPGKETMFNVKRGDENYIKTFGLQLLAGNNFDKADTTVRMIVNETFVKAIPGLTVKDAPGKKIIFNQAEYTIQGVVKDFNLYSLRNKIMPCAILNDPKWYRNYALKVSLAGLDNTIKTVEKIWTDEFPEYVYELNFLADHIGKFYVVEEIVQKLIGIFCIIAIIISCLGLYGLIAFVAVQKSREIGVRKTLGASVGNIVNIFIKELAKPLLIGYLIAAPVTFFAMSKWLGGYQYHISIGPGILLVALVIPFVIGLITVGHEALKAAFQNPIKSLKAP